LKIGIVGHGVVGTAVKEGFENIGHEVVFHDIKFNTSIKDIFNTEICYICVPTPSAHDGSCNTSIVESVVEDLNNLRYQGIIAIKSTVTPGTTKNLQLKYPELKLCFVPEFLRERRATEDFIENHDLCVVGTFCPNIYEKILESHGTLPRKIIKIGETEAELVKYFNNVYNATLITFANSFYELCESLGADYTNVKNAAVEREHINDVYLNCNEDLRGFGGMCLPKDTKSLAFLCLKNDLNVDFFKYLIEENNKYKTTVFKGMRK
jgi:UDPglucose 6-dehydrogenase